MEDKKVLDDVFEGIEIVELDKRQQLYQRQLLLQESAHAIVVHVVYQLHVVAYILVHSIFMHN